MKWIFLWCVLDSLINLATTLAERFVKSNTIGRLIKTKIEQSASKEDNSKKEENNEIRTPPITVPIVSALSIKGKIRVLWEGENKLSKNNNHAGPPIIS